MRKPRFPATLAFAVVATGAAVTLACGGDDKVADAAQPADAQVADGPPSCLLFCIPTQADAGVTCPMCADEAGNCPGGCRPVG